MERSRLNISMLPKAYKTDLIKWNLEKLPFKDSYVDAFVTDMVIFIFLYWQYLFLNKLTVEKLNIHKLKYINKRQNKFL